MAQELAQPTYILGYSGIDGYLSYKNKHIDGLTKHESFVSQGMDAAAALIKDGKIIAACAEERFTGQKHTGSFPKNAIDACLKIAGITINDLALIAHNFNYEPYRDLFYLNDYSRGLFDEVLCDQAQAALFKEHYDTDVTDKFRACEHHDTHGAYAFETSGFDDSLVVVADGLGEYNSVSVYRGSKTNGLELLKAYGPASSLGMLYSAITDYLGFVTNSDEYKIMGLAAYGDASRYKKLFDEIVVLDDKGSLEIKYLIPQKIESPKDRETYRYFKEWLGTQIFPERKSDDPVEQQHKDFTAALQVKLNEAMTHIVGYWQAQTGLVSLCMAGGVALNCVANAHIAKKKIFKNIYIGPASADDGTSLGAALVLMRQSGIALDSSHYIDMPFYGPEIELSKDDELIKKHNLSLEDVSDDELASLISSAILEGRIVAWAQGGMEFGPRALGHRSILADPRKYEMRDRLNTVTKQRESFRPFAPIVKEEALSEYFDVVEGVTYKHMLVNVTVKEKYRNNLQAITHVDGTARVQSVSQKDLPVLWKLLDCVEKQITIPVLLNTSFNLKSMPIVCSGKDALQAFVDSDIDLLVINNAIVRKQEQ